MQAKKKDSKIDGSVVIYQGIYAQMLEAIKIYLRKRTGGDLTEEGRGGGAQESGQGGDEDDSGSCQIHVDEEWLSHGFFFCLIASSVYVI